MFNQAALFVFLPLAAFSALLLYWIYRTRTKPKPITIPCLDFLPTPGTSSPKFRKITYPIQIFVEFLALLLLSALIAGLTTNTNKQHVIEIVIDNSQSMRTIADSGSTRLAQAIKKLREILKDEQNTSYILNVLHPSTKQLEHNLLSKRELFRQIEAVEIFDVSNTQVSLSSDETSTRKTFIVTDSCPHSQPTLTCVDAFERAGNIAIVSGRLSSEKVKLELMSYNSEVARLKLELGYKSEFYHSENIELEPFKSKTLSIKAPAEAPKIEARLTAKDKNQDRLLSDSTYYLTTTSSKLLLIGPSKDRFNSLIKIFPESEYSERLTESIEKHLANKKAFAIFDQAPAENIQGSYLNITPLTVKTPAEQVISFDDSHTLLRYIEPASLQLRAHDVAKKNRIPLLKTETKVAAAYIKTSSYRQVYFGFDLLPFEGNSNSNASILLLNAMGWGREDLQSSYTTGQIETSGLSCERQHTLNENRVLYPGFCRNKEAKTIVVNSYHQDEANTTAPSALTIAKGNSNTGSKTTNKYLFAMLACAIGLILTSHILGSKKIKKAGRK